MNKHCVVLHSPALKDVDHLQKEEESYCTARKDFLWRPLLHLEAMRLLLCEL